MPCDCTRENARECGEARGEIGCTPVLCECDCHDESDFVQAYPSPESLGQPAKLPEDRPKGVRAEVEKLVAELEVLSKSDTCMARLHVIERMILTDVIAENRHLQCEACLKWMALLVKKARGDA